MKQKKNPLPKKQQQGLSILLGAGLGVMGLLLFFIISNNPLITTLKEENESKKENFIIKKEKNKTKRQKFETKRYFDKNKSSSYNTKIKPYNFNPNTITKKELLSFGLSERVANNILNYVNAGGIFRHKEDLKKLYTMSDEVYNQLAPFIIIPKPNSKASNSYTHSKEEYAYNKNVNNQIIFDLNKADTIDLQAIRGIGISYAKRIFNYGQKLGGYIRIEQLKEVYGMTDSLYKKIIPFLKIENPNLRKININSSTLKEFMQHPYIDFHLAKAIIKLRDEMKGYKNVEDIRQIHLLDESNYNKLIPYLEL